MKSAIIFSVLYLLLSFHALKRDSPTAKFRLSFQVKKIAFRRTKAKKNQCCGEKKRSVLKGEIKFLGLRTNAILDLEDCSNLYSVNIHGLHANYSEGLKIPKEENLKRNE